MVEAERIQKAIKIIEDDGTTDGDHHKAWVIDQVLRALLEDDYYTWRHAWENEAGWEWEEGIAP